MEESAEMSAGNATLSLDAIDLSDQSFFVKIRGVSFEDGNLKFLIDTKTSLPGFVRSQFSVYRHHEEFIWLYDCLEESEHYAGYIIPQAPSRPDVDSYRKKVQKLQRDGCNVSKEEQSKMREEVKEAYVALFRKTITAHNIFLQRLANHRVLKNDNNFRMFLEYDGAVSVKGKSKTEKLAGLFSNLSNSADGLLLPSSEKDVDEFFEHQTNFLSEYHTHISDCTVKADAMTRNHRNAVDCYLKISSDLSQLATVDESELATLFRTVSGTFEKAREIEAKLVSDEDFKLSDTLRYYMVDTAASKALITRRQKYFALYVAANKSLEKAQSKNKDIRTAENIQQQACQRFEAISKQSKQELQDFKTRRVSAFGTNLSRVAELELKYAESQIEILKCCLMSLREEH